MVLGSDAIGFPKLTYVPDVPRKSHEALHLWLCGIAEYLGTDGVRLPSGNWSDLEANDPFGASLSR